MSADATIELRWADGDHRFRLPLGQLRELQDKCGAGPLRIAHRLRGDDWLVDDVREPIRLGLIGAGMKPTEALTLVLRYVDARPLYESVLTALAVLSAALFGVPEDQPAPGKEEAARPEETTSGLRFSGIYGNGAALGFTPRQIDEMSLWQFAVVIEGWNKAQGGDTGPEPLSVEEYEADIAAWREGIARAAIH